MYKYNNLNNLFLIFGVYKNYIINKLFYLRKLVAY